ncbi:CgeB family protein [Roseivivax sediminis]|uniref:Spore maturation protein CgeB n=1 Tax=Roseivivax sediminis TaxID=936889 RepID=A0A1I1UDS3_9RHOB|nr:glycosyltransferase [Roseivivax sediminis]SFD68775.1 spore maturation protein CgeB [Roseivivax sediminis]
MPFRIVLTSSILSHPLNKHILSAMASAARNLGPNCELHVMPTGYVLEPGSLDGTDLLVFLGSLSDATNAVEQMPGLARRAGAASVFWSTEDPYERDFAWRAREFDYFLSNDGTSTKLALEREDVHHLPLGGSYEQDFRPMKAYDAHGIDIFFCGAPYQNRQIFVEDMRAAEIEAMQPLTLHLAGAQWKTLGQEAIDLDLTHTMLQDLYARSRFVLYLHRSLMIANERQKLVSTTPGPRLFEAALAGTVQICEFVSFEIEDYFSPETEIRLVQSGQEGYDAARDIAADPERWRAMALAAQRRAIAEHCYEHRLLKLLEYVTPRHLSKEAHVEMQRHVEAVTNKRLAALDG